MGFKDFCIRLIYSITTQETALSMQNKSSKLNAEGRSLTLILDFHFHFFAQLSSPQLLLKSIKYGTPERASYFTKKQPENKKSCLTSSTLNQRWKKIMRNTGGAISWTVITKAWSPVSNSRSKKWISFYVGLNFDSSIASRSQRAAGRNYGVASPTVMTNTWWPVFRAAPTVIISNLWNDKVPLNQEVSHRVFLSPIGTLACIVYLLHQSPFKQRVNYHGADRKSVV